MSFVLRMSTDGSALTDVVAKWLLRRTEDQEVRVQALPGSMCCFLGRDTFILLSQGLIALLRFINGYRRN